MDTHTTLLAVEAWSTFVLTVIALLGAVIAWRQVTESRDLRRDTTRAYVVIDAEGDKDTQTINLVLANVGQSYAENVVVSFDPELEAAGQSIDHGETAAVWSQSVMPPGKRITTVLDTGDHASEGLPMTYDATVRWDSPATGEAGKSAVYRIDLNASVYAIRQWEKVDQDTPKRTRALESIAKSLRAMEPGAVPRS